jgi:hypothetical protein
MKTRMPRLPVLLAASLIAAPALTQTLDAGQGAGQVGSPVSRAAARDTGTKPPAPGTEPAAHGHRIVRVTGSKHVRVDRDARCSDGISVYRPHQGRDGRYHCGTAPAPGR